MSNHTLTAAQHTALVGIFSGAIRPTALDPATRAALIAARLLERSGSLTNAGITVAMEARWSK